MALFKKNIHNEKAKNHLHRSLDFPVNLLVYPNGNPMKKQKAIEFIRALIGWGILLLFISKVILN